jgi:hypothetical protein
MSSTEVNDIKTGKEYGEKLREQTLDWFVVGSVI